MRATLGQKRPENSQTLPWKFDALNQLLAINSNWIAYAISCLQDGYFWTFNVWNDVFEIYQRDFWPKLVILNQIIHKCPWKLMKWPMGNVFNDHSHRIERFWTFILEFFPILSTFGYFSQESKLAWSLCFRKFQLQTRVCPWLTF